MDIVTFLMHLTYIAGVFAMGAIMGYTFRERISLTVNKWFRK